MNFFQGSATRPRDWTPSIIALAVPIGVAASFIFHRVSAMIAAMLLVYVGVLIVRASRKQTTRPMVIAVTGFAIALGLTLYVGK